MTRIDAVKRHNSAANCESKSVLPTNDYKIVWHQSNFALCSGCTWGDQRDLLVSFIGAFSKHGCIKTRDVALK